MTTTRTNYNPALTKQIVKESRFDEDFLLVDVGASGGIDGVWNVFGNALRAVGFDPLVSEVDRLNAEEKNSKIYYESAFVGCNVATTDDTSSALELSWFSKTSASAAQNLSQSSYVKEVFNSGQEVVMSERKITLDDYFKPAEYSQVNFLKIDTDGHDFPVLLGAERLLRDGGVLGLSIESNFHGGCHRQANTFANIDHFLRGLGFSLFDLDVWRYSRSQLPQPFYYEIPAQTRGGQVMWAEAVYFRDLTDEGLIKQSAFTDSEQNVLKLACLFEMFGLPDCAVALLIAYRDRFPSLADPTYLDLLTPSFQGQKVSHQQYSQAFQENFKSFYPNSRVASTSNKKPEIVEQSTFVERLKKAIWPRSAA